MECCRVRESRRIKKKRPKRQSAVVWGPGKRHCSGIGPVKERGDGKRAVPTQILQLFLFQRFLASAAGLTAKKTKSETVEFRRTQLTFSFCSLLCTNLVVVIVVLHWFLWKHFPRQSICWYQKPASCAPPSLHYSVPVDVDMETPLDVLSRAATLIHDQLHKSSNKQKGNLVILSRPTRRLECGQTRWRKTNTRK